MNEKDGNHENTKKKELNIENLRDNALELMAHLLFENLILLKETAQFLQQNSVLANFC